MTTGSILWIISKNFNLSNCISVDLSDLLLIKSFLVFEITSKLQKKLTTLIIIALFCPSHISNCWKVSEVIMLPQPRKDHLEVESLLLPSMSKQFKNMFLKRFKEMIDKFHVGQTHQLELGTSTQQWTRFTDLLISFKNYLKDKESTELFLTFHRLLTVTGMGVCYILPKPYYLLLKSYFTDRRFSREKDGDSELEYIGPRVPQGSVLGT